MKEKNFQTKFIHYLKNSFSDNAAFELKITHDGYIPFAALRVHQKDSLLAVKRSHLVYKIPDDSRGFKPFDCFSVAGAAYVVVQFHKPGCKECYLIDIEDWVNEEATSDRKSLTEERAGEIGQKITMGYTMES